MTWIDYVIALIGMVSVILAVLALIQRFRHKRRCKTIKKEIDLHELRNCNSEHYEKELYEITLHGKEYYLAYYVLKPDIYKEIKPNENTDIWYDITVSSIEVGRVALMAKEHEEMAKYSIRVEDLQKPRDHEDVLFFGQIKEHKIEDYHLEGLEEHVLRKIKEKEILKDYE